MEDGQRTIVGVNAFTDDTDTRIETLYLDEGAAETQCAQLDDLRKTRDATAAARALDAVRDAALGSANLMPPLLDAVRAYATVGEMCDALRDVWGEYEEPSFI